MADFQTAQTVTGDPVATTAGADDGDSAKAALAAIAAAAALSACGGGGGGGVETPGGPGTPPTVPPTPPVPPSASEASRFLAQATMGPTSTDIAKVQADGYTAWLDAQLALPPSTTRWDWMVSKAYDDAANKNSETGIDPALWRKLLSSPDTVRQRVTLALSEIVVASVAGFSGGWNAFSGAAYMDILEANAFGNYRTLLQQISTSPAMGEYLTFRGNLKFNASTGANPDENYAREVMQLFTIGLVQLNLDGTPKLANGAPQETYTLDDISGLARVFTGWNYDLTTSDTSTPAFKKRPMTQTASKHESGAKTFLGTTIPANTNGDTSLQLALDAIFAHANVAPFISRQLIQRLVTSNPTPAYVARVATVFNNDGSGVKGNLKAVVRTILLDDEARNAARIADPNFGKQREPILRLAAWARAFGANSATDAWAIGNTSDGASRLGQSPGRAPTVFNFFRPGYVPPNSGVGSAGLVAPEFQLTNESSVVGYVNYMQNAISKGIGDVKADYSALLPLADTSQKLIDQLNLLLAAGQLSSASQATIKGGIDSMASGTDTARLNRIYAATVLVMASPEFIVQK
ncbi:MAG: DUF1800 domain-containing protein [Massilia sp.]